MSVSVADSFLVVRNYWAEITWTAPRC